MKQNVNRNAKSVICFMHLIINHSSFVDRQNILDDFEILLDLRSIVGLDFCQNLLKVEKWHFSWHNRRVRFLPFLRFSTLLTWLVLLFRCDVVFVVMVTRLKFLMYVLRLIPLAACK